MSELDDAADRRTTVEAGTEFKGTMKSSCPVVVRGSLDGEIRTPALTVAETGTVVGKVDAESIRSDGVLAGQVDAEDVYLSGSVRSDTVIRASTLEVKLKQDRGKLEVTFGDCILEVGDEPRAEAADEKPMEADRAAVKDSGRPQELPAEAQAGEEGRGDKAGKKGKTDKTDKKASDEDSNGKRPSVAPPG